MFERKKRTIVGNDDEDLNTLLYFEENSETSLNNATNALEKSRATIHRVLKKHNYKPYKILPVQELTDVHKRKRLEFCQDMLTNLNNDPNYFYNILWTDESNFSTSGLKEFHKGHTVSKIWHDTSIRTPRQAFIEGLSTGLRAPPGKVQRLIAAHIGSDTGFLENSALVFISKKTGDYHEDMDAVCFERWFENVLQHLEPNSVVVLDNASYHSRLVERIPTMSDKKAVLQHWLREESIPYGEDMVKGELIGIIRQHRGKYRQYAVDTMSRLHGITILRLPPYHCELNPIELIWAQITNERICGSGKCHI
ncbi:uncharacterized protein LOC126878591 [Diabrotica virgifera virgifera]|uniref:Tc1-like transposase DDE domain-containing protein n=1 Tax=Diabrotica virgifera virgifera TaxID=50390 RepID=A0ABM5JHD9_DIAVI|nr:uncharacterized protein LOC126878591 [Diabrotica virgifera virgifera]